MAGDWIKMRGNLWDDPRVAKIVDMTDSSEAAVVGALYWLWATADQHTEDGIMQGLTLRAIDRKTGVPGFAQALCAIEWLADHPEGVRIVDFEKHNGSSAKKRCQTAKRVANFAAANAKPTHEAEPTNAPCVSSALAREREEKRREEKKERNTAADKSADRSLEQPKPEPPGFIEFWEIWPSNDRKQARGKCLDAWKKAHAERDAALVIGHVQSLKNGSWAKDGGQFVPAPLTYLNGRRWEGAQVIEMRPSGLLAGAI